MINRGQIADRSPILHRTLRLHGRTHIAALGRTARDPARSLSILGIAGHAEFGPEIDDDLDGLADRARLRTEQRDAVAEGVGRYNPEAVVCVGIPFGHTRPQWILPHGGTMTVDGTEHRVFADYR